MSDINTEIPMPPPLIFRKLLELRRKLGGLKAKEQKGGPRFPIKSSKELMEKLRTAVDELDLIVSPVKTHISPVQTESGTCCYATVTVRIEAEDGSYRDYTGCGGGMDRDDKAAGKASTYAWKDAILKGLSIPDKEMVDADDEEGTGRDVKPGKPTGKSFGGGKTPSASSDREAQARKAIEGAGSLEALDVLRAMLEKLPEQEQLNLSPVYKARKKFLTEAGS